MKAISLFSGAGGMDVGFKDAGFEVIAANEMDKHACNTFRENHPETILFEGDIEGHLNSLIEFKDIDLIFGGPPCQGFSVAGKMDIDDPRSKLVFTFCSLVEKIQPKAFVMENVKALGKLSKFEAIRNKIISRLQKSGYQVSMHILNAKDFGVPQSRERVFFIGVKHPFDAITLTHFDIYKRSAPTLRDVLKDMGAPGSKGNEHICNAKITLAAKPVLRKSPYAGMLFNGQGRPLNPDGWASTLPASMGGNRTPIIDNNHLYQGEDSWVENYHQHLLSGGKPQAMHSVPSYLRRLTINEAAVIQGFPTKYKFIGPNSKVYSQIGNGVPCHLAFVVAKTVIESLKGKQKRLTLPKLGENLELAIA